MDKLFQALAKTDGVLIIDQNQRIIYWNRMAKEILGYSRNEVIGRPCYEILGGRDEQGRLICQKYCRVAMTALNQGAVTNYDSSVRTKSRDIRWINTSTFTFPLNGSQAGLVLVHLFRDVTSIKQNEEFINQVLAAAGQLQSEELPQRDSPISAGQPKNDLTDREYEVLTLLAQGLGTKEIAESLTITPSTTRNYVRNILQKLRVHSRLEAVLYAQQHGLVAKS